MGEQLNRELSEIANPFDFANPVSKRDLFIGRDQERQDIRYYLDLARNAERSINLALLGERAAGKTSLLNIVELEASDRGLIPVRIDLNESDVESQLTFWFKLFDAIMNRVVEEPRENGTGFVFSGVGGKTYLTYLAMASNYQIPDDLTFCPFRFPVFFAHAMAARNLQSPVSDQIIKRDLTTIASEVSRPILLLIDECNVLSSHRALLEMVRNTFMNLPGYMLVFTGTPSLFPLMDEVFSPIVRQFKRIEVAPFTTVYDTCLAVKEPLNKIGQSSLYGFPPENIMRALKANPKLRLGGELQDLHDLTGGKPYEIQLVCHFMFKRVQLGDDEMMRLSYEVIEDVLRELRQSHDTDARPVISAVKSLNEIELKHLGILLMSAGKIPVTQVIQAAYITGKIDSSIEELTNAFRRFVELGILSNERDTTIFLGDDFDRIVCKYAARQRKVSLFFEYRPFEYLFPQWISSSVAYPEASRGDVKLSKRDFTPVLFAHEDCDLDSLWNSFGEDRSVAEIVKAAPKLLEEIYNYYRYVDDDDDDENVVRSFSLWYVKIYGQSIDFSCWFRHESPQDSKDSIDGVRYALKQVEDRCTTIGMSLEVEVREFIGGFPLEELTQQLINFGAKPHLKICSRFHASRMYHCYMVKRDRVTALRDAKYLVHCISVIDDDQANNTGYILLANGMPQVASEVLELVLSRLPDHSLATYNLGLARIMLGQYAEARNLLNLVKRMELEQCSSDIGVLLFPVLHQDGRIEVEERWAENGDSISLCDAATISLKLIETLT